MDKKGLNMNYGSTDTTDDTHSSCLPTKPTIAALLGIGVFLVALTLDPLTTAEKLTLAYAGPQIIAGLVNGFKNPQALTSPCKKPVWSLALPYWAAHRLTAKATTCGVTEPETERLTAPIHAKLPVSTTPIRIQDVEMGTYAPLGPGCLNRQ